MRIKRGFNPTIVSMLLILIFFSIRMMMPNNIVIHEEVLLLEDFESAKVIKIIDGDTIKVSINGIEESVRFIGINTPEKNEPGFDQATDYTKSMLQNKEIFLEKDESNRDRYNRLLRYIWLEMPLDYSDNEKDIKLFNGMLLTSGYAEIATYKPDVKNLEYYEALVEQE